jgi:hypothetical protein
VIYSKSVGLCELCHKSTKKPLRTLKVPRCWIEKKWEGDWLRVTGFELEASGKILVLTKSEPSKL